MKFQTFLRYAALGLLGMLLAMPVVTLPGALHLVMLAGCLFLLGRQVFAPGVWPLVALCLYTLLIGAFHVSGLDDWKEVNSQQMRQVSVMLLAFFAMRRARLSEFHLFFAVVLLVAAVGVLGEMRGLNMHDFLPAKVSEQSYYTDAGFLPDGEQRYRGFFTESSILLAATTGYACVAALGAFAAWRWHPRGGFVALTAAACTLGLLFLLAVTLAKTGLVLMLGGGAGWTLAWLQNATPRRRLRLVAGVMAALVLFAAVFAVLPAPKREYFLNDLRSLPAALEGNSKLEATASGGLLTRVECWRIAVDAASRHPLGVGLFGIADVVAESNSISLTGELRYLFGLDIYGLKNTLANVLAQTGLPGMCLLFAALWQGFVRPVREAARRGEGLGRGITGLYYAGFCISVLFLVTCETYYWMAFPVVLRCYADSLARARRIVLGDPAGEGEADPTSCEQPTAVHAAVAA